MTATDRLERDLATWFQETAAPAVPDYTDALVRQAVAVRQPRRWAVLERWIPMSVTTLQPVRLDNLVPWRTIALVALLALALVAGVALVAASRPTVPAPFGLANNGLIAYAQGGDVFTVDPRTDARHAIATGLDQDAEPRWSPDGTRVVFFRGSGVATHRLVMVDADGGNPVTSADAFVEPDSDSIAWAPDGRSVAVAAGGPDARRIHVVDATDGSSTIVGDGEYAWFEFFWRPPDGGQLLFAGRDGDDARLLLYTLADRSVVELAAGPEAIRPIGWTADGSRYAYQLETETPGTTRVVDLATASAVDVPVAYGRISNDGTRIAGLDADGRPCVAAISGGSCEAIGTVDQAPFGPDRATLQWSPDDRWIVSLPAGASRGAVLLQPQGGIVDQPEWLVDGFSSWQRVP
jgi:Tol biopolymer transport system component